MIRFFRAPVIVCLVLILIVCPVFFSGTSCAGAQEEGIKVKINDKFLSLPQPPVRIGNTTMLPFRAIYEFLGAKITWDKNTNKVTAYRGFIKVELELENGIAKVNDEKIFLNVAPRIIKGTTMVPAWFFVETLGAQIDWDAQQQVVSISMASVSGINLETRDLTLKQGETEIIAAEVFPDNALNKNIVWSSTSSSVASVHKAGDTEAVISAINPGSAIIIAATEEGGYVATCKVWVEQEHIPVTGISLNKSNITLRVGAKPETLIAYVSPETATEKSITWKSSNTGIVSVHKNAVNTAVIAPLKEGSAIISAITEDGKYEAICTVTVQP